MTDRRRTGHLQVGRTKTGRMRIGLGLLVAIAGSSIAMGGDTLSQANWESIQPEGVQSFDSVNFPIQAIVGELAFQARAGWIWKEGNTHRIVLNREVDVTIADHHFIANAANVWLRKISVDTQAGTTRYQIYAIFEDLRSADGTVTMKAKQMPVRGVIDVPGGVKMTLDAKFDGQPNPKTDAGKFVERTNGIYRQRVFGGGNSNQAAQVAPRKWSVPGSTTTRVATENQEQPASPAGDVNSSAQAWKEPEQVSGPIFHPSGVFSMSIGGRVVIDGASSGDGAIITADGGVVIQYQDPTNKTWIDFKSERMVMYTTGSQTSADVSRMNADQIEGVYLEGGVFAGDDQWSMRSPRMYLDVVNNRALMLDSVFWTTDQKTAMPLYLRAQSIRQTAQNEFVASKAKISNTAFFEPDLTIGVSDIRVKLATDPTSEPGQNRTVSVEGKHVTLNAGSVPVLWLPGFKGDPSSFPLRQITITDSNRSGLAIKSRWNAISLLQIVAPPGIEVDLNLDYYAERGVGIGVESKWDTLEHKGGLFSYLLANDEGTDITPSGRRIRRDGETRGVFQFSDIWKFANDWTLITQANYASDEVFIPALLLNRSRRAQEFTNRLQFERQTDQSAFSLELSSPANDFIVPEHQLQSPGYSVSKVPEARFISLAHDLLPDIEPGLLSYSFEARAGVLRLAFSEVAASAYGLTTNSLADDAFGTLASESLGDKFRALGLDESAVTRLDTRHELRARFDVGPIRVNPFIVGRVTAYDDSFDAFSPAQREEIRYFGAGGVTLSTTISKVDNDAESRFFDVHRLRHIIEPSITIWGGDSNFENADVPIFDEDVEGLIEGTAFRAALDQTWQTKRGGIGRWRDVDVLKLRTEYVWTSEDAGQSPIPQYYYSRPELSNPGEYIGTSMIWKPTEVLGIAGEIVYDLDLNRTARASIGAIIEHRPGLSTTIAYREVQPLDATFASFSARYRLTDKYAINTRLNYNFDQGDFQTFSAQVLRRFQIGSLGATIRYNNIRNETSFGFVFRPSGSAGDLRNDPAWGG